MAIEIMSPAGSFESLNAAIKAGANSVYFGVDKLNMRARAALNFTLDDLPEIVKICSQNNAKTYLTLNIVLYDEDLEEMQELCNAAKQAGISAVIASDIAAIKYAKSIHLPVHISTQCNISNIEAVKYFSQFADVVVLARELNINQIKSICDQIKQQNITGPSGELVKIEIFAHGALCVSISGKCYMSLAQYNHSANRGDCLQACRRSYNVKDEETGDELSIENKYVMSPKDLCTIKFLDKLLDTGVQVLKIEGRGRAADYVYTVTKAYREAADLYEKREFTQEKANKLHEELKKVFNRGFWEGGYYLGTKLGEWCDVYGSKATQKKIYVGRVENYYTNINVASFILESGEINENDKLLITGPTTGVVKCKAKDILIEDQPSTKATKGQVFSIKIPELVRKNDKLFVLNHINY